MAADDRTYYVADSIALDTVAAHGADALAVWVYVTSKPLDWVIRSAEVQRSLNIGRRRYNAAMSALRAVGVVTDCRVRDENGRYTSHEISASNYMPGHTNEPHLPQVPPVDNPAGGLSTLRKNHSVDNRYPLTKSVFIPKSEEYKSSDGLESPAQPQAPHAVPVVESPIRPNPDILAGNKAQRKKNRINEQLESAKKLKAWCFDNGWSVTARNDTVAGHLADAADHGVSADEITEAFRNAKPGQITSCITAAVTSIVERKKTKTTLAVVSSCTQCGTNEEQIEPNGVCVICNRSDVAQIADNRQEAS